MYHICVREPVCYLDKKTTEDLIHPLSPGFLMNIISYLDIFSGVVDRTAVLTRFVWTFRWFVAWQRAGVHISLRFHLQVYTADCCSLQVGRWTFLVFFQQEGACLHLDFSSAAVVGVGHNEATPTRTTPN